MRFRTVALAVLLFLSLVAVPMTGAAQQSNPDTLVGTIYSWDARKGELRVLVGVGMALRTANILVPAQTPTTIGGTSLALTALRAGDVVRVIGGTRPEGYVAYSIDRIALPGSVP